MKRENRKHKFYKNIRPASYHISQIFRELPKLLFKDVSRWKYNGEFHFAIPRCTVKTLIGERLVSIAFLKDDNTVLERRFPIPKDMRQLIEAIIETCGTDILKGQMVTKNKVEKLLNPTQP